MWSLQLSETDVKHDIFSRVAGFVDKKFPLLLPMFAYFSNGMMTVVKVILVQYSIKKKKHRKFCTVHQRDAVMNLVILSLIY